MLGHVFKLLIFYYLVMLKIVSLLILIVSCIVHFPIVLMLNCDMSVMEVYEPAFVLLPVSIIRP